MLGDIESPHKLEFSTQKKDQPKPVFSKFYLKIN